jgi:hypothetical protein
VPRYHPVAFFQLAWWLHWKYVGPRVLSAGDRPLIVAGALSTKKKPAAYEPAVAEVVRQVGGVFPWKILAWPDVTDPGIQIADYCAWAIQRKWERQDVLSYALIQDKIATEFPAFAVGSQLYLLGRDFTEPR